MEIEEEEVVVEEEEEVAEEVEGASKARNILALEPAYGSQDGI